IKFTIDNIEAYEYPKVYPSGSFSDDIMLIDFPEKGTTIVIYMEGKINNVAKIEEFRRIIRTIKRSE
ncbi:MAG: hypothetical protein Q8Q91_00600, partial [Candidatus Daviesbacteria bacterium]|nr:hypothetical protein [Candidatus Daviesbacteria bacterium]